jgi:hypothetical protein
MTGRQLCAAPLRLLMRPKVIENCHPLPCDVFLNDWHLEAGREFESSNCKSGNAKHERRNYPDSTRSFRGRLSHHRIECISFQRLIGDWTLSSSYEAPCFPCQISGTGKGFMAFDSAPIHLNLIRIAKHMARGANHLSIPSSIHARNYRIGVRRVQSARGISFIT